MAKDFYISYSRADNSWAEWIASVLEEAGYTVLVGSWDFRPGSNFIVEMMRATQEAVKTIGLLSPDYLNATFIQDEWQHLGFGKGSFLPVRVRKCELHGALASLLYVDLVDLDEAQAKAALLRAVAGGMHKPRGAPRFPAGAAGSSDDPHRFPNATPAIWKVPYPRNEFFTDRLEELTRLRHLLLTGDAGSHRVIISGIGGIGKTALALEYAYRYRANYQIVLWIDPKTANDPDDGLTEMALRLTLQEGNVESRPAAETLAGWLRTKNDWLVVLDEIKSWDEVGALVSTQSGHVIMTTRSSSWDGPAGVIRLSEMKPDQAVLFTLRRTGQANEVEAQHLAQELGYFPLALDIAASDLAQRGEPLSVYLERYRNSGLELFKADIRGQRLESVLKVAIQEVENNSSTAVDLINVCAFLAPEDIPQDMLIKGAPFLPPPLTDAENLTALIDDAVKIVVRHGLGSSAGDALSVNPLVQAVARRRLSDNDAREWAEAALNVVSHAFPPGTAGGTKRDEATRLLPHALAAARHAEALGVALATTLGLLHQVGVFLHGRARLDEAERILRHVVEKGSLEKGSVEFGPESLQTAAAMASLGALLQERHDLAEAERFYREALRIYEAASGPLSPMVAQGMNKLAGILYETYRLDEAEKLYRRALKIRAKDPAIINSLAGLLRDKGQLATAERLYRRALRIQKAELGPDHPNTAGTLSNLAGVLYYAGRLDEAEGLYQRALEIDEKWLGSSHPNVAQDLNNLALVLAKANRTAEAEPLLRRALAIDEQIFGPDHPSVATDLNNLAQVLASTNRTAEAEHLLRRALAIDEAALGPYHPSVAIRLNNLANLLKATTRLADAEKMKQRALLISQKATTRLPNAGHNVH